MNNEQEDSNESCSFEELAQRLLETLQRIVNISQNSAHSIPFQILQGGTIHNLVINGNMSKSGNEYYTNASEKPQYSDEEISRAITAVSGKGNPLSLKRHFVGIICALQSMGWPRKFATCCTKINSLPGHEYFPVDCDSNAIKSTQLMRFTSVDYKEWGGYEPKTPEEAGVFRECKWAADSFIERLKMQGQ